MSETIDDHVSEAEKAEDKGEYFYASHCYQQALEIAKKVGDSEKIKLLKRKSRKTAELSILEFKTVSVSDHIPHTEIEANIKKILTGKSLENNLKILGLHPSLIPNKKTIQTASESNRPIFLEIARVQSLGDKGSFSDLSDDPYHRHYMDQYGFHHGIIRGIYLPQIFTKLRAEYGLDKQKLFSYLQDNRSFFPHDLPFIEVGLEHYFKGEYMSAIFILVPKLEKVFMQLSDALGIDTNSLKRKKLLAVGDMTLSDNVLRKEEFTNIWKADFCELFAYVFYDEFGLKLRHKVAHGYLPLYECNQHVCELVLYFYIAIATKIKVNSK